MSLTKATYSMIDGAVVNVLDYGMIGDDSTDSTAGFNAVQTAVADSGYTIFWPKGSYIVNDPIVYDPTSSVNTNFRADIHWKGVGGHHTYRGTRLWAQGGDSTTACITIKSGVQMSFEDIDFVANSNALALLKITSDGPIPAYSSFNITFRRCRFASTTPVNATVFLNNCSNITFEQCFFQGAETALQIGSNSTDPENVGTYSTGTADNLIFNQCFFNGDVVIHRCRGVTFESCAFDENTVAGTGRGAIIYARGDQLVRGISFQNCWAGYGNDTGTWFTCGTNGYDITVQNCYIATYQKGIRLNGVGCANIIGNEFKMPGSIGNAIDIDSATFYGANVQNNHFDATPTSAYLIQDARSNPASPPTLAPFDVNLNLEIDHTIGGAGSNYNTVLTTSKRITGGLYNIVAMMTISSAIDSIYTVRVNLTSQTPRVTASLFIPAGTRSTITLNRYVMLDGTAGTTDISLDVYQRTAGTAGTVKATDTDISTTMLQLVRADT